MKVWCDAVDVAAIGKTAGTYDAIGTVTVKKGASVLIGILAAVCPDALTAGESAIPILQAFSKDLSIANEKWVLSKATLGDPIATNNDVKGIETEFIPLNIPGKDDAKIDFTLSANAATTDGWSAAVGLMMADGIPDTDYKMELLAQQVGPTKGGDNAESDAGISAATYTAFTETIAVPANAGELRGIFSGVVPNAPTADKNAVGITKFECSSISDFAPQEWPFCIAWTPSLGTPVGRPPTGRGRYYPTRFELPGVNVAVSVSQILALALTNAADGVAAFSWT